jgi:hypothetical protein
MKIGLVQVDGKLPNLALMQICAYHEARGHQVEWFKGELYADEYDEIYASKIFAFSELPQLPARAKIGGTGIDFFNTLPPEIAECEPSYSLYPDCNYHIGFSMKGCRFRCKFCCVPTKEGKPRVNSTIPDLLKNPNGGDRLMLLDNDFFGGSEWKENLETVIELNLKVCFVQGLNIRILKDEQAELLGKCRYYNSNFNSRYLTFAWDRFQDGKLIFEGLDRLERYGIPPTHTQFFVLVGFDSTHEQNMDRVTRLWDRGALPYVMPYDKFNPYQKAFTRWVNHRAIFKTVKWGDYAGKRFTSDDMTPVNAPRMDLPILGVQVKEQIKTVTEKEMPLFK